jgi:hypothetical protein
MSKNDLTKPKLIIELTHDEDRNWEFDLEDRLNKIVLIVDNKEIPFMYRICDISTVCQDEEPKTLTKYKCYGKINKKFEKFYSKIGLTRDDITPEFLSKATEIKQIDFKTYHKTCGETKKWIPNKLRIKSLCLVNDEGWMYKFPDYMLSIYNTKLKESEMRRKKLQEKRKEK